MECDQQPPVGYRAVRCGYPNFGELYLNEQGQVFICSDIHFKTLHVGMRLIVEKEKITLHDLNLGEKFVIPEPSFDGVVLRKIMRNIDGGFYGLSEYNIAYGFRNDQIVERIKE